MQMPVPVMLLLDSAGLFTVPVICMVLGAVLLSSGVLGGGIKIKEIAIPRLNTLSRVLAGTVGICFIIFGVYASDNHRKQLKPLACSEAKSLKSNDGDEARVRFTNKTHRPVSVSWIGFEGQRQEPFFTLNPSATLTQQTYQGHAWLVEDERGHCLAVFMPNAPDSNAIVK